MVTSTPAVAPRVSVVLPVRNESRFMEATLQALRVQSYPAEALEIIVADGASEDDTRAIVERLAAGPGPPVLLVDNEARSFAAGFNRALARASGDFILMLGGHTRLPPQYVTLAVEHLAASDADCVGGVLDTVSETGWGRAIARAMRSRFGVGGIAFRVGVAAPRYVDTVAFGMYRRECFARLGGLDEGMIRNQDDEFNYRLRAAGGKILLTPNLRCRYESRGSLAALWRQYFDYGRWKVPVMRKHPGQMQPRHFVPAGLVAGLASALLAGIVWPPGRAVFALLGSLYVLSALAATVRAARAEGWRDAPRLPVVFACLHFAYGAGFLSGLWHFRNRRP